MNLDFRRIRTSNGSQSEGFEEFCCQIARGFAAQQGLQQFFRLRGAGGDGGIECYCKNNDSTIWGWQAKYLFDLKPTTKSQLDQSIECALDVHPDIRKYFICLPFDLTGPTQRYYNQGRGRQTKSQIEKIEEWKSSWEAYAKSKGMEVDFILWTKSDLIDHLLALDPSLGKAAFWFDDKLFSQPFLQLQIQDAAKSAEPRYSPNLTVEVPIYNHFEAFGLTEKFKIRLMDFQKRILDKVKSWEQCLQANNESFFKELPQSARPFLIELVKGLKGVEEQFQILEKNNGEFNSIQFDSSLRCGLKAAEECKLITKTAIEKVHGEGKAESIPFRQYMAEYMVSFPTAHYDRAKESIELLIELDTWSQVEGILATRKAILLIGPAGIGKTHSICDIALSRQRRGFASLIFLGENFNNNEPWDQMRLILGLDTSFSRDQMLNALEALGESQGYPVLIFIDAINETTPRSIWRSNLKQIVEKINRLQWVKICFSCRSTYLEDTIPSGLDIFKLEHLGFVGIEHHAFRAFFEYYNLEVPAMPLLQSEFTNPLFLKLICETLTSSGLKYLPFEFFGLSHIVQTFIQNKEEKIAIELDYDLREGYVNRCMLALIDAMVRKSENIISWYEAKKICDGIKSSASKSDSIFHLLIREGLLRESQIQNESGKSDVVAISFERLGEYLIAKGLLECVSKEGIGESFEVNGSLHFLVKNIESIRKYAGVLEALAILLPEKFDLELSEVAGFENVHIFVLASIEWRHTDSLKYETEVSIRKCLDDKDYSYKALEILLAISSRPNNWFNSNWFSQIVKWQLMPDRDRWLSPFLYNSYKEKKGVFRLIHWALELQGQIVPASIAELWISQLCWFLSASVRDVRDNATMAIIFILEKSSFDYGEIIRQFSDVNDEYILERILSAGYGHITRATSNIVIESIANAVYENIFLAGILPANAMIRDNARLIVDSALKRGIGIGKYNLKTIEPPYSSQWPLVIPEKSFTDRYKESYKELPKLYQSCFDDDFSKYTISSAISQYEGITQEEASRWIFKRVLDLGYTKERHQKFDAYLLWTYGQGRSKPSKIERIGKKYQWIALYQLLGILGDHASKKSDRWFTEPHNLQGRTEKNLDPTTLLKEIKINSESRTWWAQHEYQFHTVSNLPTIDWIKLKDFPEGKDQILVKNPESNAEYYVLQAYLDWTSDYNKDRFRLNKPFRQIEMQVRSYLVHESEFEVFWKWNKQQNYFGRLMPEGGNIYSHLIGEYPFGVGFQGTFSEWEEWREISGCPAKISPASLCLLSEQEFDQYKTENYSFEVPAKIFFDKSKLVWNRKCGFNDEDGKTIFDFPAVNEPGPHALIANAEYLQDFLKKNGFVLVWTILSERQSYNGHEWHEHGFTAHNQSIALKDGKFIETKAKFTFSSRDGDEEL